MAVNPKPSQTLNPAPLLPGLAYQPSKKDEYPHLLGKLIQHDTSGSSSRLLPASTDAVNKVFEALRRISGSERQLAQIFKKYDRWVDADWWACVIAS